MQGWFSKARRCEGGTARLGEKVKTADAAQMQKGWGRVHEWGRLTLVTFDIPSQLPN